MAALSSWLVGSATIPNFNLTVAGVGQVVLAGTYYLYDTTAGLSLIKQVENAIAAQVAGSTVRILQNRKVKIDFNGNSTTLAIPATLAALLGFTSSPYGAATSRTAENVSPLLWSPGWPETPSGSPVGVQGHEVWDRVVTASPTGLSYDVVYHSSSTVVQWDWYAVRPDRAWTTAEADGEYVVFFAETIIPGNRFKLYSQISEDDESTSNVTWTTGLGPYFVPEADSSWYVRFKSNSDMLGVNISIAAVKTSEIS